MEQKLLNDIRSLCPETCSVKSLPTRRRGNPELVVVTYPADTITPNYDVDDWAIEQIHHLHHDKIRPLGLPVGFRMMYCCKDRFVLYSPFACFFNDFEYPLGYEVYGDGDYQKYVGSCSDINKVIAYLTTKEKIRF